ncbi:MAG: EamA family transporter [Gammaproteobacteria bacterium]|nr:EamA family transporter [Gammaproteobacteria bacterium]NKB62750.1 EamA family transporter [Gammaproteobacteria bacterium]
MLIKLGVPLVFVVLWSTGFVGAKFGLPSAEPFTFLTIRTALNLLALLMILPFIKVSWPRDRAGYVHLAVVGVLIHGVYLGGVFAGIYHGLPASIAAIIVGLQPLITSLFAMLFLREVLTRLKVLGLVTGFIGIILVVGEQGVADSHFNAIGVALCVASLFGISIGTIYQKKFCGDYDLLPGVFVQYAANCVFMAILAFLLESQVIYWNLQFVLTMGWLVVVLSIGAVLLLMWLIRQGEAGRVASLFYLVPPLVAAEAWFLFDERFGVMALIGMFLCMLGVAMVLKSPTEKQ